MFIITHRGFFFWLTGLILTAAIGAILFFGLPLGMDFTGGSLMHVSYQDSRPALADIEKQVSAVHGDAVSVRTVGTQEISIRTRTMTPEEHEAIFAAISQTPRNRTAYTSVGPALGSQFTNKALWAIFAVVFVIVFYIAFAFRKVSRPVPSWGYGLTVVAMLAIDPHRPVRFYAAYAHLPELKLISSSSRSSLFSATA